MPVVFFVNKYGDYSYLGGAVATVEEDAQFRTRTSVPVGAGGRYSAGTLFDSLSLTFEGTLKASDPAAFRDAWDAFKAAHAPGSARKLYLESDRYCRAEVTSFIKPDATKGLPWRKYSFTLTSYDDPPWFADVPTVVPLNIGANAFNTGGTGLAAPVFTAVFSAAPVGGLLSITDASGSICTLAPDAAGTFVLDSLAEAVTSGGADKFSLLGGELLMLPPGANTLTVALSGGAALTSLSLSYQSRWY